MLLNSFLLILLVLYVLYFGFCLCLQGMCQLINFLKSLSESRRPTIIVLAIIPVTVIICAVSALLIFCYRLQKKASPGQLGSYKGWCSHQEYCLLISTFLESQKCARNTYTKAVVETQLENFERISAF